MNNHPSMTSTSSGSGIGLPVRPPYVELDKEDLHDVDIELYPNEVYEGGVS